MAKKKDQARCGFPKRKERSWLKFWLGLVRLGLEKEGKPGDPTNAPLPDSWKRLRMAQAIKALQDAGFVVEEDPEGFWRVFVSLTEEDLNPDWYRALNGNRNAWKDETVRPFL